MFRAEAHHHPLAAVQVADGVQIGGVRQRLQIGESQHLATLAAYPGLQQFVAPLVLPCRLAGASDADIRFKPPSPSGRGAGGEGGVERIQRLHRRERHRLHRERAGDAQLVLRFLRLVVQGFLIGMGGDGGVHLPLHGLAGGMESIEGCPRRLWPRDFPTRGEIEGDFPFP